MGKLCHAYLDFKDVEGESQGFVGCEKEVHSEDEPHQALMFQWYGKGWKTADTQTLYRGKNMLLARIQAAIGSADNGNYQNIKEVKD